MNPRVGRAIPQGWERVTLTLALLFVLFCAVVAYNSWLGFNLANRQLDLSRRIGKITTALLSSLKDAETGQRGLLLTGRDEYLEPYRQALSQIPQQLNELRQVTLISPVKAQQVETIKALVQQQLTGLQSSIDFRRANRADDALTIMLNGEDKARMDQIRLAASDIETVADGQFVRQSGEMQSRIKVIGIVSVFSGFALFGLLCLATATIQRATHRRQELIQQLGIRENEANVARRWFETTLDSIGDAVIATDTAGKVTLLNPVAQKLTGWSQEQAAGIPLEQIFVIHNESTGLAVDSPVRQALRDGQVAGLANHTRLRAKDGREIAIDDSAAPIRDASGQITGVVLVFRDVTERVKAENASAERARFLQMSVTVSAILSGDAAPQVVLQQCSEALAQHLDAAFFQIWTMNQAEQVLELEGSAGKSTHLDGRDGRVKMGEGKIGRIAQSRQAHLTNDILNDPDASDHEWARREGIAAFAGYPLLIADRVVGVAAMFSSRAIPDGVQAELKPICNAIAQFIQRKQTEVELKHVEDRFRTAILAVSDILWTNNPKGEMEGEQPGWASFTGQTFDEYQGYGWAKAVHPDDAQPTIDEWNRVVAERRKFVFEHRVRRHDGVWRRFSLCALPVINASGAIQEWVGVHTDITDRKEWEEKLLEAEERLRHLADNIPQLAWIAEAGTYGQVPWFNENWFRYTGTTLAEMQGTGWHKVHHPEHAERVIQKFSEHVQAGLDWEDTFPLRNKDGEFRWFLSRMKCIRDQSGKVVRIFGSNTDITEQRAAELELRRANEDLTHFAFAASHDLQEPLRMISSYSQLLVQGHRGQLSSEAELCIGYIEDGTKRMRELLADLLSYTGVTAQPQDQIEAVDLNLVLQDVTNGIRITLDETGAVVSSESLPVVLGHRAHFVQLVQNLISNAIKYRAQRPPRIHISAEWKEGHWVLAVADNGIGIASEHHQKIFGVFKRLHGKNVPGTGIGLAICQRVVERYKGRIWVESQPDKGATFYFTLPGQGVRKISA